jgi:aspartate kinase
MRMRHPIVVQKYGGSSVADAEKLRRVAARVVETARAGKRVCVVVSAMGDTTDELLALAAKVSASPPRRELDMLVSCGERISMALLSMAIAELGCEAISFTGSQSGIMTNDRHSGARIIEVRPIRIEDELERGKIVIVAGFQGVSYRREITTLGRGGSDTTAVALAAALGAEHCEICSDVDGIYTADPRVVDAAQLISAIGCDEMQELAEHGARVMNPQAVEFARRAGIAIYARATAAAPLAEGGTRIGGAPSEKRGTGVTGLTGLTRVRVRPRKAAELAAALSEARVPLKRLHADEDIAFAQFTREDLPDWPRVRAAITAAMGDDLVGIDEELACASVVGQGVGTDPSCLQRALTAAAAHGIEILGCDVTPLRLTLTCAPGRLADLVRALHTEHVA